MGIPRLTSSLEPYAIRSQLNGRVVIDGPAFAYHILYICRRECHTNGSLNEPTYAQLGETALQWLSGMEECGITISAIYFDGYLPASKKDVRLERVYAVSQTLSTYYSSTSGGIPSNSLQIEPRGSLDPFQSAKAVSSRKKSHIPIPAFLVPSILDGLRASRQYRGITHLVPGEADAFCANDVRHHSGTILTSDSDLLLYDLGTEGSVAFLKDIEFATASIPKASGDQRPSVKLGLTNVSGLVYTAARITERLSLEPGDGLLLLGFELQRDPYPPFSTVVSRSKTKQSSIKHPEEYTNFMSQYRSGSVTDATIPAYLCGMDPRISEFILQWTGDAVAFNPGTNEPPEDDIEVFLPPLLDRWDRTSAWDASMPIRQLAYGLMKLYNTRKGLSSIVEYRRTQSKISRGRQIELLLPTEIVQLCKDLLQLIQDIDQEPRFQGHQWIVLALLQDILQGKEQEKEALALELWKRAAKANGILDPTAWDTIHFTAWLQGTYYSLRMLQQVLGLLEQGVGRALPAHQANLKDKLDSLPSISGFPTIGDVSTLFSRLRNVGGLDGLKEMAELSGNIPFETPRARKRRKREQGKKSKGLVSSVHKTRSSVNPFDVLG